MDKLKLIHNKDNFILEINNTPIKYVTGYKIECKEKELIELTLKMSIDISNSSIDIDNKDIELK